MAMFITFLSKVKFIKNLEIEDGILSELQWSSDIEEQRQVTSQLLREIQRVLEEARMQLRIVRKGKEEEIIFAYIHQATLNEIEVVLRWTQQMLRTNRAFMDIYTKPIKIPKPKTKRVALEMEEEGEESLASKCPAPPGPPGRISALSSPRPAWCYLRDLGRSGPG